MLENANLLCEIGTEEIPAGYISPALSGMERELKKRLEGYRISYREIRVMATPRRLVFLASEVSDSQSEDEVEIKGPSSKAAYDDDGKPTKALQGFLKGNQVDLEDTYLKTTDKGEYVFAKKRMSAKKTIELIPEIIGHVLRSLHFPKRMKWSNKNLMFPRPISYFLILFNDEVVPFELEGIVSSNVTRGHYIQHNKMIKIPAINMYEDILKTHSVIVDQEKRMSYIRESLEKAAKKLNGKLVFDEELLETVTYLTEDPVVVTCEFDKEFLPIPDIVLITEMKEHQKYFAVRSTDGTLLPFFLVVSNNPETPYIKIGNERVISARFNDARFFFNEDRKTPLIDKVDSLKSVLFHKELGTIYQKAERMEQIAQYIARSFDCSSDQKKKISRAVMLCKADLNTAMVFEFTSLQGQIGRIYALHDGEDSEVADAIDDHYKPRFQDDPLPSGTVSIILSLAEKIDNIFGSFSVGNIPTGSQDPYALRRQALAIVEMLIERALHLDLKDLLENCKDMYKKGNELVPQILEFISTRARTIFGERGLSYDEIDACMTIQFFDFLELFNRAQSIHEFRKSEEFTEMLLSFKRMNNIVNAFRQKNADYSLIFNESALVEDTEKNLYAFFNSKSTKINEYIEKNEYESLFRLLIEGKTIIDSFFDTVLVMTDDTSLRDTRLALLDTILQPFKNLLDFSKIAE